MKRCNCIKCVLIFSMTMVFVLQVWTPEALYYVKLVTGWWEFFMLCLQLCIQAVVLTSVILLAIERLRQCGKE
nr:hypothetical protein [Torque teno Leptonychotes weddellii virus 2]